MRHVIKVRFLPEPMAFNLSNRHPVRRFTCFAAARESRHENWAARIPTDGYEYEATVVVLLCNENIGETRSRCPRPPESASTDVISRPQAAGR